jgi:SH3-like domain-containing protein
VRKQDIELAFLSAKLPVRVRKHKDGFLVYRDWDGKGGGIKVENYDDLRQAIAKIKMERGK